MVKTQEFIKLIGNIIIGGAIVTTLTKSSIDDVILSKHIMIELHKEGLLQEVKSCKLDFCKYFVYGKQHKVSSKTISHTKKDVLDYVHVNI